MAHRVLIAEDEIRIVSLIEKGLRANGFLPVCARDGASALDLAMRGGIDLILLDLGLPDLDGFSVLRQLRGAGVAVPVVVLTARDGVRDTVAALEGGADDYMTECGELLRAHLRFRR